MKSKIKEPLEEFKDIYAVYSKMLLIIKSCAYFKQVDVCNRLIGNFDVWCSKFKVNDTIRNVMVKHLKEVLKERIQEIRET